MTTIKDQCETLKRNLQLLAIDCGEDQMKATIDSSEDFMELFRVIKDELQQWKNKKNELKVAIE